MKKTLFIAMILSFAAFIATLIAVKAQTNLTIPAAETVKDFKKQTKPVALKAKQIKINIPYGCALVGSGGGGQGVCMCSGCNCWDVEYNVVGSAPVLTSWTLSTGCTNPCETIWAGGCGPIARTTQEKIMYWIQEYHDTHEGEWPGEDVELKSKTKK